MACTTKCYKSGSMSQQLISWYIYLSVYQLPFFKFILTSSFLNFHVAKILHKEGLGESILWESGGRCSYSKLLGLQWRSKTGWMGMYHHRPILATASSSTSSIFPAGSTISSFRCGASFPGENGRFPLRRCGAARWRAIFRLLTITWVQEVQD